MTTNGDPPMDLYDRLHPKPGAEQETAADMLGRLRLERRARNGDKTAVQRLGPNNAVVKLLSANEPPGADGAA